MNILGILDTVVHITRHRFRMRLAAGQSPVAAALCRSSSKIWRLTLLLGFIILHSSLCLRVFGQSYTIDWYKVPGGGGTSSGGQYSLSGTIGQPDAGGEMTGGNYSLTGGFWSLIAVQTPGAPLLTITHSGNSVTVSWPSPSTGFRLEQNGNVANAAGWSSYGGTINDNGTIKSVTFTGPTGDLFLRLINP